MNTLNKALEFQKNNQLEKAHLKYDELGRIEILQLPNVSNNPTINRLKYLYCRNRGMLRLRELIDHNRLKKLKDEKLELKDKKDQIKSEIIEESNKDKSDVIDIDILDDDNNDNDEIELSIFGEITGSINDLLNAIVYGEPDIKIIQVLGSLFNHFGHPRLARLCYELKLSINNEDDYMKNNDDLKININKPEDLLINQIDLLDHFIKLLNEISDNTSHLYKKVRRCLKGRNIRNQLKIKDKKHKYDWNDILTKSEWDTEQHHEPENIVLNITVNDDIVDFTSLMEELVNCIPKPKGKNKSIDGYYLTKSIFEKVEFNFDIQVSQKIVLDITDSDNSKIETIDNNNNLKQNVNENERGDAKEDIKIKDVIASRTTRSTRTKPEPETNGHAKTKLKNYDIFISQTLPSFLQLCNCSVSFQPLSKLIFNDNHTNLHNEININVIKFYSCVKNWNDEYTQCLTITDNKKEKTKNKSAINSSLIENESIREILNLKPAKVIHQNLYEKKDMTLFYRYLKTISKQNLHFDKIRFAIVKFMFEPDSVTGASTFCVESFNKKTVKYFKSMVDCISIHYYNEFEHFIVYDLESINSKDDVNSKFNFAVSIFELLVDSYLEFTNEKKLKKTLSFKNVTTEIQNSENLLINRIEKWKNIIEDAFSLYNYTTTPQLSVIWARFIWFKLYYLQSHSNSFSTQQLANLLTDLLSVVKKRCIYLPFVNFELIPVLHLENIQTQFSKLKILEIFDKYNESNEILERVLLNEATSYNDDNTKKIIQTEFKKFVETSNLSLKLRLWSLLLRFYRINDDIIKYKLAFEKILDIMMKELNPEKISKLSEHQSKITILSIIGFFGYFSNNFIHFCDTHKFNCFSNNGDEKKHASEVMKIISLFLYMFYSFLMYQNAVQIDGRTSLAVRSSKSFEILNNCICNCFFLLSFYFPSALVHPKSELINDFLSICHIELGFLHMCSSIDGIFLKYLQYKLTLLNFDISANDVFQIIHCRFGLSISLDGFETFDHKCKPRRMTMDDAIQLSKLVSTYCFRGKHPLISPPRNDIKNIIDKIVDVVGDPNLDNIQVSKNKNILDSYLSKTNIDLQFVVDIFHGKFQLNFEKPEIPGIEVAANGFYYIEGLIGLHFFKVRKRTMQSRAAELDYVLKMLQNDIFCGCSRFENWVALGQTYSFLVEDDIIWTADKLNSVERKQMTSFTQKKALLCYFMAIGIHLKSTKEERKRHQPIVPILWESFAKELYSSWMEPMNKKAFHTYLDNELESLDKPKQLSNESNKLTNLKSRTNDIPNDAVFKLLELSFKSAAENNDTDWYSMMYLAKSQCKMQSQNIQPRKIIENLLKACSIALKQSYKDDPIIEPHYYLFSVISKFYRSSKITLIEAIDFFKEDELFAQLLGSETKIDNFTSLTLKILFKIISYDRKNWQHRPVYRLAQTYYYMMHDREKAQEELLTLINLKPNIRSLSTIWKPTAERPGKHFIYNSVYTKFLVQILYEIGDIYSLTILLKKMRRAGSIMVNLTKTFDNMTLRICILIKKSLNLLPGFLDDSISKIKYPDFIKYCTEYIEHVKKLPEDSFDDDFLLHLFFVSETQTFRKLATGFGGTGLIDECYHSIYIKLFLPFLFKRLIEDRNNGVLNKELLEASKEYFNEKLLRSKQSTPDLSSKTAHFGNEFENSEPTIKNAPIVNSIKTSSTEHNEENNEEGLGSIDGVKLTMKESYCIINYLSFGKTEVFGTPNKEKIRVARRDVSPFAMKLVNVTQNLINSFKEKTNDGETIDYKIKGPIDNSEFEKAITGVMVKETKENKEDKEFDELISAHNRSFTDTELEEFNKILNEFSIDKLSNVDPKIKVAKITWQNILDKFKESDEDQQLLEGSEEVHNDRNSDSLLLSKNLEKTNKNVLKYEKPANNNEVSHDTDNNNYSHDSNYKNIINGDDYNENDGDKNINAVEDDVDINRKNNNENIENNENPFNSPKSMNKKLDNEINKVNIEEPFDIARDSKLSVQLNEKETEPTKTERKACDITPSRITQSVITNFFKISPAKPIISKSNINEIEITEEKDKIENANKFNEIEDKGVKISYYIPINKANDTYDEHNDDKRRKITKASTNSPPSRRHSTRSLGHVKLLELGKSGNAREQVDIKLQRENTLIQEAEILSSSDSSDDNVIVID